MNNCEKNLTRTGVDPQLGFSMAETCPDWFLGVVVGLFRNLLISRDNSLKRNHEILFCMNNLIMIENPEGHHNGHFNQ